MFYVTGLGEVWPTYMADRVEAGGYIIDQFFG